MKIPSQYLPVMPYIIVENANGFLNFSKNVFGATEQMIVPGEGQRGIMHGEIRIFDAVIMFADKPESFDVKPCGMFIYVDDVNRIHRAALENNVKELMSPSKQEYGFTSGFEDEFGNQWWIVEAEK